ncbi:MAG: hypothetical protein QM569_02600 [Acidovorax sp.]|uniref:capsular polysaccharide export protein, LipB/KpsS family n=1 Tax=Acidovorax sp. TaxID=1872122 RepID=UPI0039E5F908
MKKISRRIYFLAAKAFAFINGKSFALSILDRSGMRSASVQWLRFGIDLAKKKQDKERLKRYADIALDNYPGNTIGYLESAEILCAEGDVEGAYALLLKSPRSKQSNKKLAEISLQRRVSDEFSADLRSTQAPDPEWLKEAQGEQQIEDIKDEEKLRSMLANSTKELRHNILNWASYRLQSSILLALGENDKALGFLMRMPRVVSRGESYYLLLARAYKETKNFRALLEVMRTLHCNYPQDHRYLLRIAEIYRDDGNWLTAYVYIKAARLLYPEYGSIRQLTFEADHLLIEQARETLKDIEDFTPANILKFLPMINRVSVFFPDMRASFSRWRATAIREWKERPFRSTAHFNKVLNLAIKLRWYDEARQLLLDSTQKNITPDPELCAWHLRIEQELGGISNFLCVAHLNENQDSLLGILNGAAIELDLASMDSSKVVEVFIPTAFFSDGEDEKPSYSTVRTFLRTIYEYILSRSDIVIVPRHQFNWRYADRRLVAKALSYHTSSAEFDSTWMHVQEASLAGRCTMDHQGFAGFSSLATDHEKIRRFTQDLPDSVLEENYQVMYEKYVQSNVSKYAQSEETDHIEGRYVFVALQVPTDVVAMLAHIKGVDMLRIVAEHYAGTDVKVVVKRHPYCSSVSVEAAIGELKKSGKIIDSHGSVHHLIDNAEAVYVVNSGVGLETLLHMKPIIVAGSCDYSYAASVMARSELELRDILNKNNALVDRRRVMEFLYYYMQKQSIACDDASMIEGRVRAWLDS